MKWTFKWLLRLVLVVVALVILLLVSKDSILRVIAENRIRSHTGMEVKIGKFSSRLFSPVVTIENLKLYNTAEFGGVPFADIPELHIECDRTAFAQRKLRITLARLSFAELDVVRNAAGQTNIFCLAPNSQAGGSKQGRSLQAALGDFTFDGIDVLNLSMNKLRFIDLKDPKNNREFRVNMDNQIFPKVKSEADLYGVLFLVWLRSSENIPAGPAEMASRNSGNLEKPRTHTATK